jgi:hypothetical protein
MISPEEIKHQATSWWPLVLQCHIRGEQFFPRVIDRIGKVKSGEVHQQFGKVQNEVEHLFHQSKNERGSGYWVETASKNFRRSGSHELPERIIVQSLEDYLYITGKKKEWSVFVRNLELVLGNLPKLKEWTFKNVSPLYKDEIDWNNILQVCQYFLSEPRPQLYIRQLPIEVHTKFIEENATLLQSLLDFLIPEHIRQSGQKKFAEHYFLKYDEPLIRIRVLDEALSFQNNIKDISLPLSSFLSLNLNCRRILISENKMNFLTLPDVHSSVAIWSGGGFNISYLKGIQWLASKEIYYWGDIDEHGFLMLHQIRTYYPQTKSLMMDKQTFALFENYAVTTPASFTGELSMLNPDELSTFDFIRSAAKRNRLEQERIPQSYVVETLTSMISTKGPDKVFGD